MEVGTKVFKEIIVDINPYQTRVVLLEDGKPSEIHIERRGRERLAGNIYAGRVQNVLPGMQAAFVDVGLERNAFLYAGDVRPEHMEDVEEEPSEPKCRTGGVPDIRDMVHTGQKIMVQVLKEPVGTKGARVTTHITLPGRTLVLMPTVHYIGVSRRIGEEKERARLKHIMEEIVPPEVGVIVRTAGEGKTKEEFETDLHFLLRLWQRIQQRETLVNPPRLLHAEEALIFRTMRDLFTQDVDRLVINEREFFERAQLVAGIISPDMKDRVELYEGEESLFDKYGLETRIEKALSRKVWLNNGGFIVIDQTEALTSIDVNTGRFVGTDNLQETITQANCEAAREIARQLRLRDISGIIIIDFIDMEDIADKERVLNTLREELKKDRTKSNVLGITQLGLVEMTRKKIRQSISNTLQVTCPYCNGDARVLSPESMVLKVRKNLLQHFKNEAMRQYLVEVHPDVAALIEDQSEKDAPILPTMPGKCVYVRSVPTMHMEDFNVIPLPEKVGQDILGNTKRYN